MNKNACVYIKNNNNIHLEFMTRFKIRQLINAHILT